MSGLVHGTPAGFSYYGCRCDACGEAYRAYCRARYKRRVGERVQVDQDALADLLHELAPDGLTEDCPARKKPAA